MYFCNKTSFFSHQHWVTGNRNFLEEAPTAPNGSSAGWRAIWVHPPAGAAGAFDVSGAAKASKGPVVPDSEVAKVAEACGGRGW